jgi:hypothetical protein
MKESTFLIVAGFAVALTGWVMFTYDCKMGESIYNGYYLGVAVCGNFMQVIGIIIHLGD